MALQTNPSTQPSGQDDLARFRSVVEDAVHLIDTLSPHCHTSDELSEVCKLGLANDGQLRLLLHLAVPPKTGR